MLEAIAAKMKHEARITGYSQRKLTHGLGLTLRRDGLIWTLSLTRWARHASDHERRLCRETFGCPEIKPDDLEHYQAEHKNGYCITRFIWIDESEQTKLLNAL